LNYAVRNLLSPYFVAMPKHTHALSSSITTVHTDVVAVLAGRINIMVNDNLVWDYARCGYCKKSWVGIRDKDFRCHIDNCPKNEIKN